MVWMLIVESATVHRDSSITFKFYNGLTVKWVKKPCIQ
jgi:hypothetical protein